eukprot:scaffold98430_cov21-Tisochrysis_lutea.AAC.1
MSLHLEDVVEYSNPATFGVFCDTLWMVTTSCVPTSNFKNIQTTSYNQTGASRYALQQVKICSIYKINGAKTPEGVS